MELPLGWQAASRGGVIEVRFALSPCSEPAPALLLLPESDGPWPLAVIQHPATSTKDDYFVRDVGMNWARRGWACLGLDAPYHGERQVYDPMRVLRQGDQFRALSAQFATELSATVDAVAANCPVDLGRLGFAGYSMGSMLGIPAVAADGRYRAAVFCLIGEGGLLGAAADAASPVQHLATVAVRIVAKQRDEYFSRPATEALYDALPGEKDLVWLPGGHFEIGPDVIAAAESWLQEKL
jgi:dienelactone hydrolase